MNKVEMKRTQLSEKFGIDTICNLFCMFARGRRKIPQKLAMTQEETWR